MTDTTDAKTSVNNEVPTTSEDSSGQDAVEAEAEKPNELQLDDKILKQVEFYFSDSNIVKDQFLLKHVQKNKQGFVSLKLIAGFKRMTALTKDLNRIADVVRKSNMLVVSDDGLSLRRKNPLPTDSKQVEYRTVIGLNVPVQEYTIDKIAEYFGNCGKILHVRILRPNQTIPADLQGYLKAHYELGTMHCVLVEFETVEEASKAVFMLTNRNNWRSGVRVDFLVRPPKRYLSKISNTAVPTNHMRTNGIASKQVMAAVSSDARNRSGSLPVNIPHRKSSPHGAGYGSFGRKKGPQHMISNYGSSMMTGSPKYSSLGNSPKGGSPNASPWVLRRRAAATQQHGSQSSLPGQKIELLRQPRGPDGSRGFTDQLRACSVSPFAKKCVQSQTSETQSVTPKEIAVASVQVLRIFLN